MTIQQTTSKQTVCPLDCADTCSLSVELDGQQIVRVRGSDVNPFTAKKICAKVANHLGDWVQGEGRLTKPLRRVGPKGSHQYQAISWNEAYATIKEKFDGIIQDHGASAIVPFTYGGPMGKLASGSMADRFFNRLGAAHLDATPLCTAATNAAWNSVLGDAGGIAHTEVNNSDLIVVWANNITATHLHLVKPIRQARAKGAKLVVIDAKKIRIANDADLFIQPKPGTDVVLALATANLLAQQGELNQAFIDEHVAGADAFLAEAAKWPLALAAATTGVAAEQITSFAQLWASCPKALLTIGVGLERTRNGGSAVRAAMAMPILMGSFGEKGAGICDSGGYFDIDTDYLSRPDLRAKPATELSVLDIADQILDAGDQPVKAVFVYNHNPVAVVPNQARLIEALQHEALFSVGFDIQMTDTMHLMDIILPACSPLEYADLYTAYGHSYLQRSEPILEAMGDAKPNTQVFSELAKVFEFDDAAFDETVEQMINRATSVTIKPGEASDGQNQPFASSVFRGGELPETPSGKAQLADPALKSIGEYVPNFKPLKHSRRAFTLVTPASEDRINSTFGGAPKQPSLLLEMHPDDALHIGAQDGQQVQIVNDLASVTLTLCVSTKMQRSVVYLPKGAWRNNSPSNLSANALIDNSKADLAGGACYYDTQVDVIPTT